MSANFRLHHSKKVSTLVRIPEAAPYLIGSYTMDTTRLKEFLGPHYADVIRYTIEDALSDTFAPA